MNDDDLEEDLKELRVVLEKEVFEKINKIREYHGIKNKTEIIRFLITKEYRRIKEE